jgi:hypothetical protein
MRLNRDGIRPRGLFWGRGPLPDVGSRLVTRRHLLAGIAGGIGVVAVSGVLPLLDGLAGRAHATADLTQRAFTRIVGTTFKVDAGQGRSATLQLLAVHPLDVPAFPAPTGEGFTLLFSGTIPESFRQGTYPVDHKSMGSFAMFLVPVGPPGPDQRYEAVFNRLWK